MGEVKRGRVKQFNGNDYDVIHHETDDGAITGYYSRPNLLRNWCFINGGGQDDSRKLPINGRGKTTYSSSEDTYTIDGWTCEFTDPTSIGTVEINSDNYGLIVGVSRVMPISGTTHGYIVQKVSCNIPDIEGQVVTLSALTTDNELITATSSPIVVGIHNELITGLSLITDNVELKLEGTTGGFIVKIGVSKTGSAFTISKTFAAVKLELGDTQTLVYRIDYGGGSYGYKMLDFPDYQAELLKCQTSTADPDDEYANKNIFGQYVTAGRKSGTTLGDCATAEGASTTASGNNSHAEGSDTTASEEAAHAEGMMTRSSGFASHSEGSNTRASGSSSHVEGYSTTANHRSQHVFGEYNVADTNASDAMEHGDYVEIVGNGTSSARSNARTLDWNGNEQLQGALYVNADTTTSTLDENNRVATLAVVAPAFSTSTAYGVGDYVTYNGKVYRCTAVHSVGAWNNDHFTEVKAVGQYVTAGKKSGTTLGTYATAEGYRTTPSGSCSHAEGQLTTASGPYTHAEGTSTTASGDYSHAEGSTTIAEGICSHAEGNTTTASGTSSHAEGYDATASGHYSHTEGASTTASGNYSHAEGRYTTASGQHSHAEGRYTTANHASQHVFGEYNVLDTNAAAATAHGDYIEIVGNGTSSSARSNARTLDWYGNEVLAGTITIGGENGITLSVDSNGNLKVTKGNKTATITLS